MKTAAVTTIMAGPRTVGLGCFSPMQRLDERSKASENEIIDVLDKKILNLIHTKVQDVCYSSISLRNDQPFT